MSEAPKNESLGDAPQLTPEEAAAKLSNLKAAATKEYSLKNYGQAADFYSEATELQASINGEMSPQNAELLYAYGRCLYHVAISKSDVLGSKVAGGEEPRKKKRKVESAAAKSSSDALKSGPEKTAEEVVGAIVEEKTGPTNGDKSGEKAADKPYFSITGDENWTDSEDEEGEEEDGEAEAEEEDDDFQTAYEVLDLARVLLTKQLEETSAAATTNGTDKGKAAATSPETIPAEKRAVMERLADTHDLQAEIWLESERFSDAIPDFQSALDLKLKLYPGDSSLIAEAHYKLSLALEFASIRKTEQEGEAAAEGSADKPQEVDEEMRREAAAHMQKAIASCRLRVDKERGLLAGGSEEDKEKKQKNIKEVEEMIQDLEQRLTDLTNPVAAPSELPGADALGGILGSILGESTTEQKARIAEATKGANDLSGLIRKKPAAKRKLDEGSAPAAAVNGKKARVEDE